MTDDDDDRTAEDMFGTEPPGTPVRGTIPVDPCEGARVRPRFRRRLDGRPYPIDDDEVPETRLPDDYYSRD